MIKTGLEFLKDQTENIDSQTTAEIAVDLETKLFHGDDIKTELAPGGEAP